MKININNQEFDAEYMTDPNDIEMGMMGRSFLNGCMVFKLTKGHHSFWMKNCLIPLDIVFVNNNRISKIHLNCPPAHRNLMNPPRYTGIGDHVIELNANTAKDWNIGDRVYFLK
jgi:uncharacterized membrane protein (UPF0127 family)